MLASLDTSSALHLHGRGKHALRLAKACWLVVVLLALCLNKIGVYALARWYDVSPGVQSKHTATIIKHRWSVTVLLAACCLLWQECHKYQ